MNHISFFLYSLDGGGIERVYVNLANDLLENGFKIDFILAKASGAYLHQLSSKIRVIDFQCKRTPEALYKLTSYFRKEKPDALLSAMHYANEVAILAKLLSRTSTRIIVSEHNSISEYQKYHANTIKRWISLSAKVFYPYADGIVSVSHGVANDLAQVAAIPRERIRVIYNPVITPSLSEKASAPLEHHWFKPDSPPVILGVGRLIQQKDFSTSIKAFSEVRKTTHARLLILGDDCGEKSKLEALAQALGVSQDVSMPGFVDNPYAYMSRSAVFVLSSLHEGFGNVVAEALASGTAVVSTDCKSGPAEILADGKYGELVPVGDSEAMAKAIMRSISNPRKLVPEDWLLQFTPAWVNQEYVNILR